MIQYFLGIQNTQGTEIRVQATVVICQKYMEIWLELKSGFVHGQPKRSAINSFHIKGKINRRSKTNRTGMSSVTMVFSVFIKTPPVIIVYQIGNKSTKIMIVFLYKIEYDVRKWEKGAIG